MSTSPEVWPIDQIAEYVPLLERVCVCAKSLSCDFVQEAPDTPEYVEIGIEGGLPVSVNGVAMSPATMLAELNDLGGKDRKSVV